MAYFDNASTSYPKPECVYSSMNEFYRNSGGSVGRGDYSFTKAARRITDETRCLVQDILECSQKQVIFTPTATIALNMIIQGIISSGARNIYISPFEHNAVTRVLYHYEQEKRVSVQTLPVTENLEYDFERIRYLFDENHPDLLIMSHASNVFGFISPVKELFSLAKKYAAFTLVDMAQTAGLVKLNTGLETVDFAVFAGHKTLLGPTGISGFVMKRDIELPAVLFGGTGFDSANQDMPNSIPEKYEMGTLNIVGIAGLNAALKWIKDKGIASLYDEEIKKRNALIGVLNKYGFLHIVGNKLGRDYVGIVSCTMENVSSDSAGGIFAERGIAVRTGLQCAPKAHQFLGTYPVGTIRFSVSHMTTYEELDFLDTVLEEIGTEL